MDFGGFWFLLSGFYCILSGFWWILVDFDWILGELEWILIDFGVLCGVQGQTYKEMLFLLAKTTLFDKKQCSSEASMLPAGENSCRQAVLVG